MAKTVDEITVRLSTRKWFVPAAKVLAVASLVLPPALVERAIDRLCKHGLIVETL